MFGLNTAVYWSVVSEILDRVKDKKTVDQFGFFKIDRKYVTTKTTLTTKQQRDCDAILSESDIIAVDPTNTDRISVNVGQMVSYIINSDVAVISNVTPVVNKKAKAPASGKSSTKLSDEQKEAKLLGMRNSVFKYITETDPDLLSAYRNWIDSVVGNTKANGTTAKLFQESIDKYTNDKSVKIQLINYSALRAYIDSRWAIEYYERNISGRNTTEQKSAQIIGLNSDVEF
jgi:hypothetical protein